MRILYIIESLRTGGKERRLTQLLKSFHHNEEIQAEVILLKDIIDYQEVNELRFPIHIIKRRIKKDPAVFIKIHHKIKNFNPDVIHSWGPMPSIYMAPLAKLNQVPFINGMITNAFCNTFSSNWLRGRLTFPLSDTILSNSYAGIQAYGVNRKCCVIHNGFNFERLQKIASRNEMRNKFGIPLNDIAIIMVGAFKERKDFKTFTQAGEILTSLYNNITFLCVGDGPGLPSAKKSHSQNKKIIFTGRQADVESIVNSADIGVLMSGTHLEGISNAIMEYMALKKPVVATMGGGTNELVKDGVTGMLIPLYSLTQLVQKLDELIKDEHKRQTMGKNGFERIKEDFSIEKMKNKHIALYKRMASGKKQTSNTTKKPSILILVTGENARGGINNYFTALKKEFSYNISYLKRGARNYPYHASLPKTIYRLIADFVVYAYTLLSKKIDVVHINTSLDARGVVRDALYVKLAQLFGKRTIVFFRGWDDEFEAKIDSKYKSLFRHFFFGAQSFIVLASKFKNTLEKWGYKKKIHVETTTVDSRLTSINRTMDKAWMNGHEFTLLYLARVEINKGIYICIDTFRHLKKEFPHIKLVVAGDGQELENAKLYVKEKGIRDVLFKGFVQGEDKKKTFQDADLYLFPTFYKEGMPNSILEAMAFGLPVISRPVAGVNDFFENGKMGYITNSTSPLEIARLASIIIDNKNKAKAISEFNTSYARRHFFSDVVARRLERIYDSTIEKAQA